MITQAFFPLDDLPVKNDPPADLAAFALTGSNGSGILMRMIPSEKLPELRFVSEKEQKPIKTDNNGKMSLLPFLVM